MSNEIVLKVENLSKIYKIGEIGTGTLSHDINRWWAKFRGHEDPTSKISQINQRSQVAKSDYIHAIKDINFDVKNGQVLGIIGKNGAGKSTLLKIISRITSPTTGSIKAKGRLSSLLEVGTGMHPELTARENIYLNGSIMGMKKIEISSRFDDIIDFAGCKMFVDTPIKRFSSGMNVRLGFAVAAFLEPEILIVDEVLAVGDVEFQKQAIGKMKDVSKNSGRTVLFVSHNMASVQHLCDTCMLLKNGQLDSLGSTDLIIDKYLKINANQFSFERKNNFDEIYVSNLEIESQKGNSIISGEDIKIFMYYKSNIIDPEASYEFIIGIWNENFAEQFMLTNNYLNELIKLNSPTGCIVFHVKKLPLNIGSYTLNTMIKKNNMRMDFQENIYSFKIDNNNYYNSGISYPLNYNGIYVDFSVNLKQ
ncbi:MAG: ABC transporter ATP-binding protein [Crocinitomicaceae bacterium]|nr:ABC transporter ATP-binding protein [Crocinitomicaceae bacterium]|tara:strand:+ start:3397 stop:4659 length:1263 start_codon:yes stop_codon:yes gene_type:complete